MKNTSNILIGVGFVLIAVAIFLGFQVSKISSEINNAPPTGALSGGENIFSTIASTSAMTLTASSALITASSTNRQYVAIVNDCTSAIYLNFNDNSAVANSGIRLNASGGAYEINSQNLYKGAIRGISPSGSCVITFLEK